MPSPVDYDRLWSAVQQSRLILRFARQQRLDIARQVAGDHFAEGGSRLPVKINLLAAYQSIVGAMLVGKEPRYLTSTFDPAYRPALKIEQDWLNEQVVTMNLAQSARRVVDDALYATGFFKVSLATPCDAVRMAWGITAGEPVVQAVDFEDFVYGVASRELLESEIIGHRYRCPVSVVKSMYGRKAQGVEGDDYQTYNREGDQRIGQVLRGTYAPQEVEPCVDLWEIYLPAHRLVVTFLDTGPQGSGAKATPLWEQAWVGPPTGPYIPLMFGRVPGVALGKAPMMDLLESHLDANNIYRKISYTLKNIKENTLYSRNDEDDARELAKASHTDFVAVSRPDNFKLHVSGGSFVQGLAVAGKMYEGIFEMLGGSLSTIGGRKQNASTATQEKILNQNAGAQIEQMADTVNVALGKVGESLLWYAHHHPELVMRAEYKVPGARGVQRHLYPPGHPQQPNRSFPWHLAKLRVDGYSIRRKTPDERLQLVNAVMDRLAPLTPLLRQAGVMLDVNYLLRLYAELGDEPRLEELYSSQEPPTQGDAGQEGLPHTQTLPAKTERSYTRRNVSAEPGAGQMLGELSPQGFGATGAPQ